MSNPVAIGSDRASESAGNAATRPAAGWWLNFMAGFVPLAAGLVVLASIRGLAVCVWGCECGRGRFWWWAGASCWSAQLFLCVLGSGLAAVGQVVAVTGGLNPIVLRHRASQ